MLSRRLIVGDQPKAARKTVRPNMPALGLSARARKARELGMRALSLALARPRGVTPRAHYAPRPFDAILILQRGENPSTDYYLRPRLARAGASVCIADLADPPNGCELLRPGGPQALLVVFCRYAAGAWLEALEQQRSRLARVAFFMDDDLPAVVRDPGAPSAARGKAALHFAAHAERLGALASELWVSTDVLAERYAEAHPQVLAPLPEGPPPEASPDTPRKVVYHGTDVHERERRFVLQIARCVAARDPTVAFEIVGDASLRREAADLANVEVVPQRSWPDYLAWQADERAAISLAPLWPSIVNDARAPVKAFDAARLCAAGLYADAPAYRGFVRQGEDGLLLPMAVEAWAEAILGLMSDPGRRRRLAEAAARRLTALLAEPARFPDAPAE